MKALVLWSGGVESTSLLKWVLERTHWDIAAHHVRLHTGENRHHAEYDAIFNLHPRLKEIRSFDLSTSYLELVEGRGTAPDYALLYPIGLAAMGRHSADVMLRGWCREDDRNGEPGPEGRWAQQLESLQAAVGHRLNAKTLCPWVNPNGWTKREHLSYLGDLANLTHSCRTPRHGRPCGECHTCQILADIRRN